MDKQNYFSILKQLHDICRNNPAPKLVAMEAYNEIINFLYLRHLSDNDTEGKIPGEFNLRTLYENYCMDKHIEKDLANIEINKVNKSGIKKEIYFEKLSKELLPGLADNERNKTIAFIKILGENIKDLKVDIGRITNILYTGDGTSMEDGGQKAQKLINKIYSENFLPEDKEGRFSMDQFPYDALGEGFEKFMGDAGASGGNWGQFFTNTQIIDWIYSRVGIEKHHKIIDPFAGSGGFLLHAKKKGLPVENLYGQEFDDKIYKFLNFNSKIAGLDTKNMLKGDSYDYHNFLKDTEKSFDRVFTNPPFGESIEILLSDEDRQKFWELMSVTSYTKELMNVDSSKHLVRTKVRYTIKNSMGLAVYAIYKMLKPGGVAAFVTERGFLNNGTEKKKGWEKRLRKEIIENCNITEILLLPKGIFSHTNFDTAVIIFEKGTPTEKITFHEGYFKKTDKGKSNKKMYVNENILEVNFTDLVEKDWSLKYDDYIVKEDISEEGIEYKTLGEVCEFKRGKPLTVNKMIGGDYQVIGGGVKLMNNYYSKFNTLENQILISNDGSYAGYLNKFNKKLFITSHCNKCIIKLENFISDYLFYFLKISYQNLLIIHENEGGFQKGNAQPSINLNKMYDIKIPILLEDHQQRIVDFMDEFIGEDYQKLDMLVSKFKDCDLFKLLIKEDYEGFKSIADSYEDLISLEKHLEKFSNTYKKNMIKCCFKTIPFEYKPLGEVCEFKRGSIITKKKLVSGEFPVIGGGKTPFGYHNKFNRIENTILCSQSGAYAGYISRYNTKVWASDCFSITWKDNCKEYLYLYLKSIQDKIYKSQTGQAQPHYSIKEIEKIMIPVPSLEDQQKVVEMIEAIEHEDSQYNQMLGGIKDMIEIVYKSIENITA